MITTTTTTDQSSLILGKDIRPILDAVMRLHRPVTRYGIPGYEEFSFETAEEALDWWEDANEGSDPMTVDDLQTFVICAECGRIEVSRPGVEDDYEEDDRAYEASIWPCSTATTWGACA